MIDVVGPVFLFTIGYLLGSLGRRTSPRGGYMPVETGRPLGPPPVGGSAVRKP